MIKIPTRAAVRAHPILTDRTMLMPIDADDSHELWQIVDSSRNWLGRWLPWVPFQKNADASLRFAEASVADWDNGRALRFMIRDRTEGYVLGVVGLEACVDMHRCCDLGYWLRKEAAGQGLMTEAARACIDFGFRNMGFHRIKVAASTANHRSLRVISRLGFRFEGVARHAEWCDGRWLDHAIFGLLDDEWLNMATHEEPPRE